MKNRVVIEKRNNEIKFYLHADNSYKYMFSKPYTKGVYNYFKDGRSQNEIKNYDRWNLNPRLDDLIEYMPLFIDYMCDEYQLDNRNDHRKKTYNRIEEKKVAREICEY